MDVTHPDVSHVYTPFLRLVSINVHPLFFFFFFFNYFIIVLPVPLKVQGDMEAHRTHMLIQKAVR